MRGDKMSEEQLKKIQEHLPYERLLQIAKKMHLWIFLHSDYDQEIYDEMGLTIEENGILGSIYVIDKETGDIVEGLKVDVLKGPDVNE